MVSICESGWTNDRCTFPLGHGGGHSNEDCWRAPWDHIWCAVHNSDMADATGVTRCQAACDHSAEPVEGHCPTCYTEVVGVGMFRELSPDEDEAFRQWARDNYSPGTDPSPVWHPSVRDEWAKERERHGA